MSIVLKISSVSVVILIYFVAAGAAEFHEPLYPSTLQDPLEEATSASQEAAVFFNSGNYSKAVSAAKRALEIRKKVLPKEDKLVRNRYACMLRKAGRRQEAIDLEVNSGSIPFYRGGITAEEDLAIEGNVINGKALSLPKPNYPAEARGAAGLVVVRVIIDEKGNVIRACAITGPLSLMQVTESAAFQSKFTPTKLNNTPVRVQGIITYKFVRQ